VEFLIDTRSDVSVLPRSWSLKNKRDVNINLYAANGTIIKIYGERTLELDLNLCRNLICKFVTDVSQPILGADFLHQYSILVDIRNRRIVDEITNLETIGRVIRNEANSIFTINNALKIRRNYSSSELSHCDTHCETHDPNEGTTSYGPSQKNISRQA